jgi:ribosomal protein L20A (L18A)
MLVYIILDLDQQEYAGQINRAKKEIISYFGSKHAIDVEGLPVINVDEISPSDVSHLMAELNTQTHLLIVPPSFELDKL